MGWLAQFVAVAIATAGVMALGSGYADTIPNCPAPPQVTAISLENGPPEPLRTALRNDFGVVALPLAPFDATDVNMGRPKRRLIFVWATRNTWIVATEHGGLGYNDPISVYEKGDDGQTIPKRLTTQIAFPGTVCSVATALAKEGAH